MSEDKKIAIVYDWIDKWGGVERVLLVLHEMFPKARFYTSYVDHGSGAWAKKLSIHSSFIQKLPDFLKKNRLLSVPLYPFAFESFNLDSYDLVISVTSSFAKSVITKPGTKHICYLLTPTRFLWSHEDQYFENDWQKKLAGPYLSYLKKWDIVASQRPDAIIALSDAVRRRCMKYYKRESEVLYPPFDYAYWKKIRPDYTIQHTKFFLVVSRLELYKKVDIAIKAFNKLSNKTLVIVGIGSQEERLKQMAKKNIIFIPYVTDKELAGLYVKAEALIMPQEEDLGYVSLEAQFFGCPVIAYKKGGALETIISGKTGLFFPSQTPSALSKTLDQFNAISYNLKAGTRKSGPANAERFHKKIFTEKFLQAIS